MSAIFRIDPLFLDNWLYYKKREDIKQSTQHLLSTPAIQQKKKHNFIFFLILAPNYSLPWISLFTWNRAVPHFLFVWRTVSLMIKPISVSPWCMFELAAIGGGLFCVQSHGLYFAPFLSNAQQSFFIQEFEQTNFLQILKSDICYYGMFWQRVTNSVLIIFWAGEIK